MDRFVVERTERTFREEHVLAACVLLLTGMGLVTLCSFSYFKQLAFGTIGITLFLIASLINLGLVRKLVKPVIVVVVVLCILIYIPKVGVSKNGAARWIGKENVWTFQPSEPVKLALILYLAHIFDKKKDSIDNFKSGILPPFLVSGLFFILICLQKDFSTAFLVAFNVMVIFFLAGVRFRYFIGAAIVVLPILFLLIFTEDYRVLRLKSFLWPQEADPLGAAYQVNRSLETIASGGFWGKGIGQGTLKITVPKVLFDFIFSAFVEETGFMGVALWFILFTVFAFYGYRGAWRSSSLFNRLLAAGLMTMIISQTLLNIAVAAGSAPVTGIPMPFFSAGGSSLIITLICAGLIVNVCRQNSLEEQNLREDRRVQ